MADSPEMTPPQEQPQQVEQQPDLFDLLLAEADDLARRAQEQVAAMAAIIEARRQELLAGQPVTGQQELMNRMEQQANDLIRRHMTRPEAPSPTAQPAIESDLGVEEAVSSGGLSEYTRLQIATSLRDIALPPLPETRETGQTTETNATPFDQEAFLARLLYTAEGGLPLAQAAPETANEETANSEFLASLLRIQERPAVPLDPPIAEMVRHAEAPPNSVSAEQQRQQANDRLLLSLLADYHGPADTSETGKRKRSGRRARANNSERSPVAEKKRNQTRHRVALALERVCRSTAARVKEFDKAEHDKNVRRLKAVGRGTRRILDGAVRASTKLALPLAGAAALPLINAIHPIPGVMENQFTASLALGLGTAAAGRLLLEPYYKDLRKGRPFWRSTKLLVTNTILAGMASTALLSNPDMYSALEQLPRFEQVAFAGEQVNDYAPAHEVFSNPELTAQRIVEGSLPIEDMYYANTVSVVRNKLDAKGDIIYNAEGNPETEVVQLSALPIEFVDKDTGQVAFEYDRSITDYYTNEEIPDTFKQYIGSIEGFSNVAPSDYVKANLPWLGETEVKSVEEFMLRVGSRNLRGDPSGGSTADMQLAKMLFGREGQESMINPEIRSQVYHPELYSPTYAFDLYRALYSGNVIDPKNLFENDYAEAHAKMTDSLPGFKQMNQVCEQLERLMYGRLLERHEGYKTAYMNNIRFGAVGGREIIGIGGAAKVFFGKDLVDLSAAEQIAIISAIPRANDVIAVMTSDEPAYSGFTREQYQSVIDANITLLRARNIIATDEDAERIKQEAIALFEQKQFTMTVPEDMSNTWIVSDGIQGGLRRTIEGVMGSTLQELAAQDKLRIPEGTTMRIVEGKIIVEVDLPDFAPAVRAVEPEVAFRTELPFNSELEAIINGDVKLAQAESGMYYYQGEVNGKMRRFPSFEMVQGEPGAMGLGVVVVNERGELIGKFDETGGQLVDAPVELGSSFKVFVAAYGLETGAIKSMTTSKVSDKPGQFGLAQGDFNIVNWDNKSKGVMTWEQALVTSRNVPFQKLLYETLYTNLPGEFGSTERTQELEKRWGGFQQFLKDHYGIKIVNAAGEEIINPQDTRPGMGTELAAIGSDAYVTSAQNEMVEVADENNPGQTKRVLLMRESSLGAVARAYLYINSPEQNPFIKDNPTAMEHNLQIAKSLTKLVTGHSSKAFLKEYKGWAKTGTVFTVNGTTGTLTGFVIKKGDETRVVYVHVRGQVIDDDNLAQEMDLDEAAKQTGMVAESYGEAYPMAEAIAMEAIGFDSDNVISTDTAKSELLDMIDGEISDIPYQTVQATRPVTVTDTAGNTLLTLPQNGIIDKVGTPNEGLQQVVWHEKTSWGQPGKIRTGFIPVDALSEITSSSPSENPKFQDQEAVVADILKDQPVFHNPGNPIRFLFVGSDEKSPVLAALYQRMSANNDLALSSAEESFMFEQIGLGDQEVIVLNRDRLDDFTGTIEQQVDLPGQDIGTKIVSKRTEVTDAIFVQELSRITESIRLEEVLEEVDPQMDFQELLGGVNSPARRLIDALAVGRAQRYQNNATISPILIDYSVHHERHGQMGNLQALIRSYTQIMDATDAGTTLSPQLIQDFMNSLEDLRDEATEDEMLALGVPVDAAMAEREEQAERSRTLALYNSLKADLTKDLLIQPQHDVAFVQQPLVVH